MGLILSPEVKMRSDSGRAILFTVNVADSIVEGAFRFLYPQQAVMLSLFDGQRDLSEIKETVAYLFRLDTHAASQEVEALLDLSVNREQTIRSLIIDVSRIDSSTARIYDPSSFIIPLDKIDLSDLRCKIPCYLLVLPTMRCVTNCIYCYADRGRMQGRREFGLSLFKRLLKETKEYGIETIEFSGGDLFCRKDAFDLLECTFSEGMYPNIPTKFPLSSDRVKRLAEMGLSTIQVSIDGLSPDIIDKMSGIPDYGRKIIKTLNYLGEVGIRVRTNSVLTPHNIRDAINLARYLAKLPHIFKSNFTCYARSLYRHRDSLFCSPNDVYQFGKAFNQIREEFPGKAMFFSGISPDPYTADKAERTSNFRNRALCTANRRGVIVLPDGKITICEELYFSENFIIGDLNNQTLMEVWNSPRALELAHPDQSLVSDGACKDCPDFRRCNEGLGRCVRDMLKAYGYDRPHYWPDPRCPKAPVGNRMT